MSVTLERPAFYDAYRTNEWVALSTDTLPTSSTSGYKLYNGDRVYIIDDAVFKRYDEATDAWYVQPSNNIVIRNVDATPITATLATASTVATQYIQTHYERSPLNGDALVITLTDQSNDKVLYVYSESTGSWVNVGIDVDLNNYVGVFSQTFTDTQKTQARANIAASAAIDSYATDANTFLTVGSIKTNTSTTNLPNTGYEQDRWGCLQYLSENPSENTGYQIWCCVAYSGSTYRGTIWTRAIVSGTPTAWKQLTTLDDIEDNAVLYSASQSLTPAQKEQARTNIGAQAENDNTLQTTAKTVTGAINELDSDVSQLSSGKVDKPAAQTPAGYVYKSDGQGGGSYQAESGGGGTWGSITGTLSDQTDLQNALNAKGTYSKPSGGIPLSDISSSVQTTINGAEQSANKVTSITSSSTDTQYPSAKAVYNLVSVVAVYVSPNIAEYGTVTGGNIYRKGDSCTVTAVANSGYSFVMWKITGTSTVVSTNATYTFTVTDGINLTAVFKDDALAIVSWADGTDAQIVAMVDAADNGIIDLAGYWAVGDTRTVQLDAMAADSAKGYESHVAQSVQLVIMDTTCTGFTLTSSGETPHLIIGQKDGLLETGQMNSSNTNAGGWGACKRRGWCNDVYRMAIPSTLRGIFKQFTWQYVTSGRDGTLLTANDYFALPPEKAVFGGRAYSRAEEAALFTNWAYYDSTARRIKKTGASGSALYWWECSPCSGHSDTFCTVNSVGSADGYFASHSRLLAPFGCI